MKEINIPGKDGPFPESLHKYRNLLKAREIFIRLFPDDSLLVNLGYTRKQIEFAKPVLKLLDGSGKVVVRRPDDPYLTFDDPIDPDTKTAQIYCLPDKKGYWLYTERDEAMKGLSGLSRHQRLLKIVSSRNPVIIFPDSPVEVAHIAIFKDGSPIDNLNYLVPQLFNESEFFSPLGAKPDNPLSRIARSAGIADTYKATWIDDTKQEFIVRYDPPARDILPSKYVRYKILKQISDSFGPWTPVGKKANTSEKVAKEILETQWRNIVTGQLSWQNI